MIIIFFEEIPERLQSRITRFPPDDCWIWTGSTTRKKIEIIPKTRRDKDFIPVMVPCLVKPYATFKHKKKVLKVHRHLAGVTDKTIRMTNFCGSTLCVNPKHWTISGQFKEKDKAFFDPETEIEDAKNVIDGIGIPRNLKLDELFAHPLLVDYSHDAIVKALKELVCQ